MALAASLHLHSPLHHLRFALPSSPHPPPPPACIRLSAPCRVSTAPLSAFFGDCLSVSCFLCLKLNVFRKRHRFSCTKTRRAASASTSIFTDVAEKIVSPTREKAQADTRTVVAVILGGGAGTRLFPLTNNRAKAAVPIGGAYRLIDVPMSNCINHGINKVYILTQFNSTSLNRHLARTYNFGNGVNFSDGFVEVLAATQTPGEAGMDWFQGSADAVRQFVWLFEDTKNSNIDNILILSGDHLYRMNFMDFVQKHKESGADITISCVPVEDRRAPNYGLMKINNKGRVLFFSEKPKGDDLKAMEMDTTTLGLLPEEAKRRRYIASMGVYIFKKDILLKLLRWRFPTANNFGSEIIPASVKEFNVQAYLFHDYWEDIGTIQSFYEANLALTAQPSSFHFYDATNPTYTSPRFLPPTRVNNCKVVNSIISHGCFLRECFVEHSVVGIRSQIKNGVELKDTVMLGADYYETEADQEAIISQGKVPLGIGQNTKIRNCIIDKNARIGKNVEITNLQNVQEADISVNGIYIRSGITIISKNSTIKDGTVI
eukprot:c26647_g1_i1 orf=89-1723(+)